MRKVLPPLFLFAVLICLLLYPSRYFLSVKGGAILFAGSVLPSMLPYFFFTKLLTGTGCVTALSETMGKPVSRCYRVHPVAAYPLLMSFLGGYPIGARVIADLSEKGLLDREDAGRACAFSSTSGGLFVLGSVGSVILHDTRAGAVILAAHYLGALANGLLYRGKSRAYAPVFLTAGRSEDLLSEAMYESVLSLALVGGFIAVGNLLGDMAADLLSLIRLGDVFSESTVAGGVLYGAFEVTRGCVVFASLSVSRVMKAALCCLAVSFGGVSILLQTFAFLGKIGIKRSKILLMKSSQAVLSFLLCLLLGALFLN